MNSELAHESQAAFFLFKFNNKSTRTTYEICLKLTTKTPYRHQWYRSRVLVVNFEQILRIVLLFQLLTSNKKMLAGSIISESEAGLFHQCFKNRTKKGLNMVVKC